MLGIFSPSCPCRLESSGELVVQNFVWYVQPLLYTPGYLLEKHFVVQAPLLQQFTPLLLQLFAMVVKHSIRVPTQVEKLRLLSSCVQQVAESSGDRKSSCVNRRSFFHLQCPSHRAFCQMQQAGRRRLRPNACPEKAGCPKTRAASAATERVCTQGAIPIRNQYLQTVGHARSPAPPCCLGAGHAGLTPRWI